MAFETKIGFKVGLVGSDKSKPASISSQSSISSTVNNKSSSTNSFCDMNMNNEMNSDEDLSDIFDINNNLSLNNAKNHLLNSKNLIYDPLYHSIPIFIQKPNNERKYKRLSNLKSSKCRSDKVKFGNVSYLSYPHVNSLRPQSTPCNEYLFAPKTKNLITPQRNLSDFNLKNLSETDTDDYLSLYNHSHHPRPRRTLKKTLNPRETSMYQTNRLSEFTPCELGLNVRNTSSFINSPIHLLMNYQKSLKEEIQDLPCKEPVSDYEPLDLNFSSKYYISLALLSLLIFTILNFYEIITNLFKVNLTSMIVKKFCVGSIGSLVLAWYAIENRKLSNNFDFHRKYYNIFISKKIETKEEETNLLKDSDISDSSLNQRDNLIVRSSSQLNQIQNFEYLRLNMANTKKNRRKNEILIYNPKIRFRFCSFVFGILIINLSILISFIYSYISYSDERKKIIINEAIVESVFSCISSFGLIFFIHNFFINLLEMSYKNNNSCNNGIIVCQIDDDDDKTNHSWNLFQRQHHKTAKKMEKIALKFLICIKFSFVFVSGIVYYLDKMTIKNSLDKILNKICIDSLKNDQILTCPEFFAKNKLFDWVNELDQRKIYLYLKAKKFGNHYQFGTNQTLVEESFKSYTPIGDFYLMLISLCILILFVSISIAFACIKSDKIRSNHDLSTEQNTSIKSNESLTKRTAFVLHLAILTVFYQGYVKTLLFNELNKVIF